MQKKNNNSARDLVHLIRGKTSNILDGLKKGSVKKDPSTMRRLKQVNEILESITAPVTREDKGKDPAACNFAAKVANCCLS